MAVCSIFEATFS